MFCSLLLLLIFILHYCRLTQHAVQTDHVDLVTALNLMALSLSRTEAWSSVGWLLNYSFCLWKQRVTYAEEHSTLWRVGVIVWGQQGTRTELCSPACPMMSCFNPWLPVVSFLLKCLLWKVVLRILSCKIGRGTPQIQEDVISLHTGPGRACGSGDKAATCSPRTWGCRMAVIPCSSALVEGRAGGTGQKWAQTNSRES